MMKKFDASALFARLDAEIHAAEAFCETVLAAPPSQWAARVQAAPDARTIHLVVQLLERMPALLERRPADALQLTALAVAIAESLDPRDSWEEGVVFARGRALRDHAYVLTFLGRDREALQSVEHAARAFAQTLPDDLEAARLALVKASALRLQGRAEEALALARQAAQTFEELDEPRRYADARITEGAILYDAGAIPQALDVLTALRGHPGLSDTSALRLAHNTAVCHHDLGRPAEAIEPLENCAAGFARAGLLTERTRSRWYLANALIGVGRGVEGAELLRAAWKEFAELGLPVEAALAAFDLAEDHGDLTMTVHHRGAEGTEGNGEVFQKDGRGLRPTL